MDLSITYHVFGKMLSPAQPQMSLRNFHVCGDQQVAICDNVRPLSFLPDIGPIVNKNNIMKQKQGLQNETPFVDILLVLQLWLLLMMLPLLQLLLLMMR